MKELVFGFGEVMIGGKAGHGKDTFASYLKKALETKKLSVLILHNADYLKYIASAYLDWNGEKTPRNREMLQKLGTERFRAQMMREAKWVECTRDIIEGLSGVYDIFIIPDLRFRSELFLIRESFIKRIYTVYVNRPDFDNGLDFEARNHVSETDFDQHKHLFKYFIENTSLDHLEEQAMELAEKL